MRVVTLNTWGMRGDWTARLPVFRQGFRELDADIVTLQETILTGEVDQAAEMLGPEYHLAQQQGREQDGQDITTASRHPFGGSSTTARPAPATTTGWRSNSVRERLTRMRRPPDEAPSAIRIGNEKITDLTRHAHTR
jgi:endonuclease/exonuclease/phosphatase family metal-dependent hydrolase